MNDLTERIRTALRGSYDIEREVGRGGMATVFLARDRRHDRPVAVKVLHPELAAALGTERFLREVRITARLNHPHILPLLDSGESDGLLFYVMPFVEGETVRDRLERQGALPVADAVGITREVADALSFAHGRGIVHRDIKPENILLDSGHALVADFGIARAVDGAAADRVTATGLAVGTPLYMAPEHADGREEVDPRSDIYSLGCVLYEMLTGAPPFTGPTAQAIVARRLSTPAPSARVLRDTVPAAVDAAVQRALARIPGDRFQTAGELAHALSTGSPGPAHVPAWRRLSWWAPVTAAAVAVLALLVWWAVPRNAPASSGDAASIAVLPLANLSADAEHQYFADGLTDELITSLSRVEGVQVASRTSSFALRDSDLDVRAIGQRLGVQSVLEGSVRRGDGRVRVSVQLINVANGYQRWSDTYERDARDALVIQEEIARAIVETVQGELGARQRDVIRGGTTDPEAYDLYLRGLAARRASTEEGIRRSVELFRTAVDRSPGFARAYVALAEAYAVLGYYEYGPPAEVFPAAAEAARAALRIDPGLGSAHTTLGYVALYYDWDWPRAEQEFRRAIALDPSYSLGRQWYANHLTVVGRFDDAEREMRQAQMLDPYRFMAHAVLGWVWYYRGDHERAVAQLDDALRRDSTQAMAHLWRGQALELLGRSDEALASMRRAVELSDEGAVFVAALARVHAVRGEHDEARRLLQRIQSGRTVPSYEIAKVYLALGQRAEALRWLERAHDARAHSLVFIRVDPQLEPLGGDPAFEQLARRVGL